MSENTWTAPVLEELSIPGGTESGGLADDVGTFNDDGTIS